MTGLRRSLVGCARCGPLTPVNTLLRAPAPPPRARIRSLIRTLSPHALLPPRSSTAQNANGKMAAKKLRKVVIVAARAALGAGAPDDDELRKRYRKALRKLPSVCELDDPKTGAGAVHLRR